MAGTTKSPIAKSSKVDTRKSLLTAGMTLLIRKGYTATSINDVVEIAGVPKGSFYYYYKTKNDFVEAALMEYAEEKRAIMKTHLGNREISPLNRVRSLFANFVLKMQAENFETGCLMGHMCQEMANASPQLREQINIINQIWQEGHRNVFQQAIESGELPADTNITALIQCMCMLMQGAMLESKITRDIRSFQHAHWLLFEQIGKPNHRLDDEIEALLAIPQL